MLGQTVLEHKRKVQRPESQNKSFPTLQFFYKSTCLFGRCLQEGILCPSDHSEIFIKLYVAIKVQELSETGQKQRSKSCCSLLCLPSPSIVLAFPFLYFPFTSFGSVFFMPYCSGFPFLGFSFQAIHRVRCSSGCLGKKASRDQGLHCRAFLGDGKAFYGLSDTGQKQPAIISSIPSFFPSLILLFCLQINTFFFPFPPFSFLVLPFQCLSFLAFSSCLPVLVFPSWNSAFKPCMGQM